LAREDSEDSDDVINPKPEMVEIIRRSSYSQEIPDEVNLLIFKIFHLCKMIRQQ
jgi:hypothetical protein